MQAQARYLLIHSAVRNDQIAEGRVSSVYAGLKGCGEESFNPLSGYYMPGSGLEVCAFSILVFIPTIIVVSTVQMRKPSSEKAQNSPNLHSETGEDSGPPGARGCLTLQRPREKGQSSLFAT